MTWAATLFAVVVFFRAILQLRCRAGAGVDVGANTQKDRLEQTPLAETIKEANLRERQPKLIAVARPHHFVSLGEKVMLDGSRSWSASGRISKFEWTCTDGQIGSGEKFERTYSKPGIYSEVLKITDAAGHVDYDFAFVDVVDM